MKENGKGDAPATVELFNQRTGQADYLTEMPEDFSDYIPQIEEAQALYRQLVEQGATPIEAAKSVLYVAGGTAAEEPPDEPEEGETA